MFRKVSPARPDRFDGRVSRAKSSHTSRGSDIFLYTRRYIRYIYTHTYAYFFAAWATGSPMLGKSQAAQ